MKLSDILIVAGIFMVWREMKKKNEADRTSDGGWNESTGMGGV